MQPVVRATTTVKRRNYSYKYGWWDKWIYCFIWTLREATPPVNLYKNLRILFDLRQEYDFGIWCIKPAKEFTIAEYGENKSLHCWKNVSNQSFRHLTNLFYFKMTDISCEIVTNKMKRNIVPKIGDTYVVILFCMKIIQLMISSKIVLDWKKLMYYLCGGVCIILIIYLTKEKCYFTTWHKHIETNSIVHNKYLFTYAKIVIFVLFINIIVQIIGTNLFWDILRFMTIV